MRLDVLMGLVPVILSYDQKMKGKSPKYWKMCFEYFVKVDTLILRCDQINSLMLDI